MASGFNLTAQLQLQAPTNTKQVATQIQSGLGNVTVPVQIQADPKALGGLNNQLKTTQKTALATGKNMAFLNRNIAEAARRFSVITVATGSFIALARGIKNSVKSAIEFERELVKISQVTDKSTTQLRSLTAEVTRLSTELGVGNQSLLETARVLSQAGLTATKTKQAMEVLANTTLAPSFDNIIDTTEGAIAILNQFGREAKKTGQDIKFLEASLDAINQVSKNFAVESADLITAIRRTGGVFEAAGGNLNELIALFTSVRQTTRESAETIATGFRTIFTRLQRSETVDALKELGVALTDTEGKFVGPLKAIEALSVGLAGLDPKDIRFNEIVEQLGGFRQIGKVIPLIKQYSVAQQALAVANNASGSTAEDAQSAQQSLAVQFQKVTQQFDALIRKFADSETFRGLAKVVIDLATAFLKFAESLENVLPQLTALAAIKIGKNIAPGILGLIGGGGAARKNMGGRIHGFSGGGWVPGRGNRDTVPAMLTPGEFVIKKSSAAKLGASTLESMNANRFEFGGEAEEDEELIRKLQRRFDAGVKSEREMTPDYIAKIQKSPTKGPKFNALSPAEQKPFTKQEEGYRKRSTAIGKAIGAKREGSEGSLTSEAGLAKNVSLKAGGPRENTVQVGGAFLEPMGIVKNLQISDDGSVIKANALAELANYNKDGSGVKTKKETAATQKKMLDDFNQKSKDLFKFDVDILSGSLDKSVSDDFKQNLEDKIVEAGSLSSPLPGFSAQSMRSGIATANIEQIQGNIFEAFISGMSNKPFDDSRIANDTWDFKGGLGGQTGGLFGLPGTIDTDAKREFNDNSVSSIGKKALTDLIEESKLDPDSAFDFKGFASQYNLKRKASGGSISGSDTVPALLTPGEFVVKKSAAQSIGYSNLANMNRTGVAKFNQGGAVGVQKFANGGAVQSGDFGLTSMKDLALVNAAAKKNAAAFNAITAELETMNLEPEAQRAALVKFARNVDSVADEAEALDQAMLAAHRDITSHGPGADRTGKKDRGAGGQADTRSAPSFSGDEMAEITQKADALAAEFDVMGEETRAGQKAAMTFRQAMQGGATEMTAYYQGLEAGQKYQEELEAESQKLKEAYAAGVISEDELNKASEALAKRRAAVPTPSKGGGGGKGDKQVTKAKQKSAKELMASAQASSKMSATAQKAGQSLNQISSAAVGLGFIFGTLIQTSNSLSEEEKRVAQAGLNAASAHIAMTAQIGSLVLETASAIMTSRALSLTKKAEAAAATGTSGALGTLATAATACAAAVCDTGKGQGKGKGKGKSSKGDKKTPTKGKKPPKGGDPKASANTASSATRANAAMISLTAGIVATEAVLAGFAAKIAMAAERLQIMIEEANKLGDAELEKVGQKGQVASEEEFVKQRGKAATGEIRKGMVQKRGSEASDAARTAGYAVAAIGAFATYAVVGAAALQAIPIAGQIAGAALLTAAAAAAASAAVYAWWNSATLEQAKKEEAALKLATEASAGFARTTFRSAQALSDFDNSVNKAKDANLSAAQQLNVLATGVDNLQQTFDSGSSELETATKKRAELERQLQNQGLISAGGNATDAVDDASQADKDRVAQLEELGKQEDEARSANNKTLEKLMAQEGALRQQMVKAFAATLGEINDIDPQELAGVTDAAALTQTDAAGEIPALANASQKTQKAFKDLVVAQNLAKAKFEEIVSLRFKDEIDQAKKDLNFKLLKTLREEEAATLAQANAEREKVEQERLVADKRANAERLSQLVVMRKQRDIIDQNNKVMAAFNDALLSASSVIKANFAAIDDIGGIESGFGAAQIDGSALDQPLEQINTGLLTEAVGRSGINTGGTEAFPEAGQIGKRILQAKNLMDAVPDLFEGFKVELEKGLPQTSEGIFAALAKAAGTSAEGLEGTPVGDIISDQIDDILKDAKGKPITSDQYQQIIDNIEETLDADLETIKKTIEVQNEFLDKMNQVNQAVIAAQQEYAEATARVIDVQERAADRMAQATGKPRATADKERGRRQAAQARLGVAGTQFGAQAGNIDATFNAAVAARDAARQAREDERKEANKFRGAEGGASPDLTGTDKNPGMEKLNKEANQSAQAFKNAKAELERMADQSALAGDIMAEVAEEQKKRGQLRQVGENIAFGSDDQRKEIAMGFNNVMQAAQQGGIQNANDEERARILKTLDSVADVQIGNTGKTGRELKAQFQADEIMRLTGNQALAQASFDQAMAGSKEEQLLTQLKEVGEQEAEAAKKLAELAGTEVDHLKKIAENTSKMFGPELKKALGAAQADPKRKDLTDALDKQRIQALKDLKESEKILAQKTEELRIQNEKLTTAINATNEQRKKDSTGQQEAKENRQILAESAAGQKLTVLDATANQFSASTEEKDDWATENSAFYAAAGMGGNTKDIEQALERSGWGDNYTVDELKDAELNTGNIGASVSGVAGVTNALEDSVRAILAGAMAQSTAAGQEGGLDAGTVTGMQEQMIRTIMAELKSGAYGDQTLDQLGPVFATHIGGLAEEMRAAITAGLTDQAAVDAMRPPINLQPIPGHSLGGLIYRSLGGTIFKPRGTDTVPAMLTPGEFVLRKSAVDRIGLNTLTAMNNGDTSAVYKARGGGVGYKSSMNRNRISGFHRGGMVGRGDVSYASQAQASGAVLQLDPANIQAVLTEFNANFGSHIDNMIGNLSTFAEAATNLASTIAGGMDVRIVMSGDLTTAVRLDGDQTEHLKNAIADSILPQIAENVAGTIENKIRELKDNP